MLKELKIQNFRCFRDQSVANLATVNIVTGPNGTGKTAFLEALYLLIGGGAGMAVNIRRFRGLPGDVQFSPDGTGFRALWRDLFYHFDENATILLSTKDSDRGSRELSISYAPPQPLLIPVSSHEENRPFISTPLNFIYKIAGKETQVIPVQVTEDGVRIGVIRDAIPGQYISTGTSYGVLPVERFSELTKLNKDAEVIEVLRKEFPQIEGISVAVHGSTPVLYAYLPSIPEAKVPMELVSAGIHKFLNILLAVASFPKGIVIVDQIEDGFYYKHMPSLCRSLLDFCHRFEVQLFLSTHSMEFVRAFTSVAGESDVSLLRSSKSDGYCQIKKFSGKDLKSAIEQGVEFR